MKLVVFLPMKDVTIFLNSLVLTLLCTLWSNVSVSADDKPVNPYDYNFCGGERVYPIVGVNIATKCGPRNQIALGRRGKISWFFPAHGLEPEKKGSYRLQDDQLAKLSLLAEVVMVSPSKQPEPNQVLYRMGINFSARKPTYVYAPLSDKYTPGNKLLQAMRSHIPDEPRLPDCQSVPALFDPTMRMSERLKLIKPAKELVSQ